MTLDFKEGIKLDKAKLVEAGGMLLNIKKQVIEINEKLSDYSVEKGYIFDEVLELGSRYLDDAITMIQETLGKMELDDSLKGKK